MLPDTGRQGLPVPGGSEVFSQPLKRGTRLLDPAQPTFPVSGQLVPPSTTLAFAKQVLDSALRVLEAPLFSN
jgi:hypothetical protein